MDEIEKKQAKALGNACVDVYTQMREAGAPVGKLMLEDCSIGENAEMGDILLVLVVGDQAKDYLKLLEAYEEE